MKLPISSGIHRLRVIRNMHRFALVSPPALSIRLLGAVGRELDDMLLERETELQLEGLVIERLTAEARRRSGRRHPEFDDGDHLIEDQMPQEVHRPTLNPRRLLKAGSR